MNAQEETQLGEVGELFVARAREAGAEVAVVHLIEEAIEVVVEACASKEACQDLLSGCGEALSDGAEALCGKEEKLMAAPGLTGRTLAMLKEQAETRGISLIEESLRGRLGGIDVGVTWAGMGIAETGTLVMDATDEEVRLASMISETHVALLPESGLRRDSGEVRLEMERELAAGPRYLSFITGPSRTADIERVLAIGVHGPLAVTICLLRGV